MASEFGVKKAELSRVVWNKLVIPRFGLRKIAKYLIFTLDKAKNRIKY